MHAMMRRGVPSDRSMRMDEVAPLGPDLVELGASFAACGDTGDDPSADVIGAATVERSPLALLHPAAGDVGIHLWCGQHQQ